MKIEMTAHIVVSHEGEWMVFGWSGKPHEDRKINNRAEMMDADLWVTGGGERVVDVKFTVDVPDLPSPVEISLSKMEPTT